MSKHKDSTIAYAVGFIEDYVDSGTQPLEVNLETMDGNTVTNTLEKNEHREEVRAMMKVISEGLTELSRENASLRLKIFLAEAALRGS